MDENTKKIIKKKLDGITFSLTEMIMNELYENTIVSTVTNWLAGSDSIIDLNNQINQNVKDRWPFLQKKINHQLQEFEDFTKASLQEAKQVSGGNMNVDEISAAISSSISIAIGSIGTAFLAVISGGAGTALIASGPIGLVIGAIIGVFAFFFGKSTIEDVIKDFIADKKIPALIKKPVKSKVANQLALNRGKFEEEIHKNFEIQLKSIYEALK